MSQSEINLMIQFKMSSKIQSLVHHQPSQIYLINMSSCLCFLQLSGLIRDLNLSKESSEWLASRLKERNLLTNETRVTYCRNCDSEFSPFFSRNEDLVYSIMLNKFLLILIWIGMTPVNGGCSLTVQKAIWNVYYCITL